MKRLIIKFIALCICLWITAPGLWGEESKFKDVSPELGQTIQDFNLRGILPKFTGKYGDTYFRPTSNVSREDLLFSLYEYDQVVKNLSEAQRQLIKKISDLQTRIASLEKSGGGGGEKISNIDVVIETVQEVLPGLMEKTQTMKEVKGEMSTIKSKVDLLESPTEEMIVKLLKNSSEVNRALEEIISGTVGSPAEENNLSEADLAKIISRSPAVTNTIQNQIKQIFEAEKDKNSSKEKTIQRRELPSEETIVDILNNSPRVAKILKNYAQEQSGKGMPQIESVERTKKLTKLSIALSMLAVIFMAR